MPRSLRDKIRDDKRRRRTIGNDYGKLVVVRKRRAVRIIAVNAGAQWTHDDPGATFGFVDLDDAGVDRLVQRLQAIRGGRRTL